MERIIEQVQFAPVIPKRKNVAAYVRVSIEKEDSIHSLIAQADYYRKYITADPMLNLVGIYSDEGLTGTKGSRPGFQKMLQDCRDGLIDMVITKSVSRFARNTVTLLDATRELKCIGVDVFFEDENIHSISNEGEIMLSLLAAIAQDQSLSTSENMKWRVKDKFQKGIPWDCTILGYRLDDDHYVIVPEEAQIVRHIFDLYLAGTGPSKIRNILAEEHRPTRNGGEWAYKTITGILSNYTYTGNLLLQRTYRSDYLTKKRKKNIGELPMYHVENTHKPIITIDEFNMVQARLAQQKAKFSKTDTTKTYPLSGIIKCACCGKSYHRRTTPTGITWVCSTYREHGKAACQSKQIPDSIITTLTSEVGGIEKIERIIAKNGNDVDFEMKDGSLITKHWQDRSRSESWTAEKRMRQGILMKEIAKCKNEKSQ